MLVNIPSILEPDFDLFGLDVGKDGALTNQLLPPHRARLGALRVHSLQCLHLLRRVPHVLPRAVHMPLQSAAALGARPHHHRRHFLFSFFTSSSSSFSKIRSLADKIWPQEISRNNFSKSERSRVYLQIFLKIRATESFVAQNQNKRIKEEKSKENLNQAVTPDMQPLKPTKSSSIQHETASN